MECAHPPVAIHCLHLARRPRPRPAAGELGEPADRAFPRPDHRLGQPPRQLLRPPPRQHRLEQRRLRPHRGSTGHQRQRGRTCHPSTRHQSHPTHPPSDATMKHQTQPNQMPHRDIRCHPRDHTPGQRACRPRRHRAGRPVRKPRSLTESRSPNLPNDASDAIPRACRTVATVWRASCRPASRTPAAARRRFHSTHSVRGMIGPPVGVANSQSPSFTAGPPQWVWDPLRRSPSRPHLSLDNRTPSTP